MPLFPRSLALPLVASLILPRDAFRDRAPSPAAQAPAAPPAEEEPIAPAPALPLPRAAIRETGAPVPSDLTAQVQKRRDAVWQVKVARRGQLVALRYEGARAAAKDEAALLIPAGAEEPIVWETTKLDTLATVRGTLRLEGARTALRMAEAPVPAGRADGRLHMCEAHEDGAGGFAVLCRVRAPASVANVSGDDAGADVWSVPAAGASVVRMDLPASSSGFAASVLGYPVGADGVVLRAEASRAAGEDRPVLTMLASERPQPQVPRKTVVWERPDSYVCFPLLSPGF